MAERMLHYDRQDRAASRGWHERFGDPVMAPRRAQNLQEDVNRNYRINAVHEKEIYDPKVFLDTQLAMMPPSAQAEIRATLPFEAEEFTA